MGTACGGSGESNPPTNGDVSSSNRTYATPEAMLKQVQGAHFSWLHDCGHKSSYNVYGALSLSCLGRHGEAIYFETYDDPSIGDEIRSDANLPGGKYYVTESWAVTAMEQMSLDELLATLQE